ncbi:ribosome production factor 1 [Nematocida sp. LUAm3]|nr:ribosome production factor 1 [Nematocida sp. LUAm3]KAI5175205.1 ribosome production factor 1 [Nematocida sp. LUAm2]KAI5178123.1 ribosome production factor 1 [Nematocida sp. LUAm1]
MRILITSSNTRLTQETKDLLRDLEGIFPGAIPVERRGRPFKVFLEEETEEEALIIRLDQVDVSRRRLLTIKKDKDGTLTTCTYSVVSYVLSKRLNGAVDSGHMPEISFTDFSDEENDKISVEHIQRAFKGEDPDFEGRQIVSFTKKRGFILCRKHRYIIRCPEDEEKEKTVRVEEIGPRLSIKLQSIDIDEKYIFRHTKNIKLKG